MHTIDSHLLRLLNQGLAHPLADLVAVLASTVGLALLPLLGLTLLRPRHRRTGVALLLGLGLSLALTLVVQLIVDRPRPEGVRLLVAMPRCAAFPSGHAALAWCAAALAIFHRPRRLLLVLGAVAGALLISASRVYLGHHHPSDVLGGVLLGGAVGAVAHGWLLRGETGWRSRLRWLFWPQLGLVLMATVLAYLRLIPALPPLPYADKLGHFVFMGAMAFWLDVWLGGRRLLRIPLALILAAGCVVLEEVAQRWASARSFELADLAADLLGMTIFILLSRALRLWASPPVPLASARPSDVG